MKYQHYRLSKRDQAHRLKIQKDIEQGRALSRAIDAEINAAFVAALRKLREAQR